MTEGNRIEPGDVAEGLRMERARRRLSRREVAERGGACESTVVRAETTHPNVRIETLGLILKGLDISAADFFSGFE